MRFARITLLTFPLLACGESNAPFALHFQATAAGQPVTCGDTLEQLGARGTATGELADLRFYVSNLRAEDGDGHAVALTLDTNAFQYASDAGQVSLIDLTGTPCEASAISFGEGTARTNDVITGTAHGDDVARITFDVRVPQALMRDVIANSTAEGAPSPLAEMYWSWQSGYRHFVMNMAVSDDGTAGEAYVHLGSTGCGSAGQKALTDRDSCTFVNTPSVALAANLDTTINVDIPAILADVAFMTDDTVGVACHSFGMQPDCHAIFPRFGLDLTAGTADASADLVFKAQ